MSKPPTFLPETSAEHVFKVGGNGHKVPIVVCMPGVMSGLPCFRGTRVLRDAVDAELDEGKSLDAILERHPTLVRDDLAAYVAAISLLDRYNEDAERFAAWLDGLVADDEPDK